MTAQKLNELSLSELQNLLKEVKLYKQLSSQLGKRGKTLFHNVKQGKQTLVVEYFDVVEQDLAWEQAKKVYKTVFQLDVEKQDVVFQENKNIKGGIKVYKDDLMVDLSYVKIERQIAK